MRCYVSCSLFLLIDLNAQLEKHKYKLSNVFLMMLLVLHQVILDVEPMGNWRMHPPKEQVFPRRLITMEMN